MAEVTRRVTASDEISAVEASSVTAVEAEMCQPTSIKSLTGSR
jgi:hypothetical protein